MCIGFDFIVKQLLFCEFARPAGKIVIFCGQFNFSYYVYINIQWTLHNSPLDN